MKKYSALTFVLTLSGLWMSCAKDNYDPPQINFNGRIVYQGEPIEVEQNQVSLQLWEPGWGKLAPINVPIGQDGSFSALLFNGNYKLVFPEGRGPFKTIMRDSTVRDTVFVALNGDQSLDVEVLPYYIISSQNISLSEGKVNGSISLEKIITDSTAHDVQNVTLYVSKTVFVSRETNIGFEEKAINSRQDLTDITLSMDVPDVSPEQTAVFARIGIQIDGVEDMLFSPVIKLELGS